MEDLLLYQIGALDGLCRAQGERVRYVKPHGALYQDMMRAPAILAAVLRALAAYDRTLPLMLMSTRDNTARARWARPTASSCGSRRSPTAPTTAPATWSRAASPARYTTTPRRCSPRPSCWPVRALRASDGSALALEAQTLCVHGDNPASLAAVRRIRDALEAA